MSQNREHDKEAAPARAEERRDEEAPRAVGAAHALAAAGMYAAARGAGLVNVKALRALAGVIGNQAMLGLAGDAAGPEAPAIPPMDAPAPVSQAEAGAQISVAVPEFI